MKNRISSKLLKNVLESVKVLNICEKLKFCVLSLREKNLMCC